MQNNTNATNCTITSVLYLTIKLDDRKDILTIEKKSCAISFDRHKIPRVNRSDDRNKTTQKTDDLAKRLIK